jgi:uncharacterized protein GlcG (DUF336 family)
MEHFTIERTVTFEAARLVLEAATKHASTLGVPVCVAVTDRSGHLVAFGRMDGAPLLSAQIARTRRIPSRHSAACRPMSGGT